MEFNSTRTRTLPHLGKRARRDSRQISVTIFGLAFDGLHVYDEIAQAPISSQ